MPSVAGTTTALIPTVQPVPVVPDRPQQGKGFAVERELVQVRAFFGTVGNEFMDAAKSGRENVECVTRDHESSESSRPCLSRADPGGEDRFHQLAPLRSPGIRSQRQDSVGEGGPRPGEAADHEWRGHRGRIGEPALGLGPEQPGATLEDVHQASAEEYAAEG